MVIRAELRAGAASEAEQAHIRRLLGVLTEYDVNRRIADEAGRIRHEVGIRLPH